MNTPWTDDICRQAAETARQTKLRAALKDLTRVLSVYPNHEKASSMAAMVLKFGMSKSRNQSASEPLEFGDLLDTRFDRLFCSCDTTGCGASWISASSAWGHENLNVLNSVGGKCESCGAYSCRKHFRQAENLRTYICPRCGGGLDPAPSANGRQPQQMTRLNQPIVHVVVLREGPLPPSADFIELVLKNQIPDALEDGASVTAFPIANWSNDPNGLSTALVARDRPEYLGDDFEIRSVAGHDQSGLNWAAAAIFAKTAKHVDPTA